MGYHAGKPIESVINCLNLHFHEILLLSNHDTWISLLHHVCNQHERADGHCDHEPITEGNHQLPWFDRISKDFEALQEIILDPDLLESFGWFIQM